MSKQFLEGAATVRVERDFAPVPRQTKLVLRVQGSGVRVLGLGFRVVPARLLQRSN